MCLSYSINAQIFRPVTWSTKVEKVDVNTYNLIATATIDQGWHLYSQSVPEGGPIPTSFQFQESDAYKLLRYTLEDEGVVVDDPIFNMKIKYFSDKATFRQRVRVTDPALSTISAAVEFMVCDETRCLPPKEEKLVFDLKSAK